MTIRISAAGKTLARQFFEATQNAKDLAVIGIRRPYALTSRRDPVIEGRLLTAMFVATSRLVRRRPLEGAMCKPS